MCALIPDTPVAQSSCCSLLDKGQLSWELRLRRGKAVLQLPGSSRGTSLRIEYSKTEPAFLQPVVKRDFRKGPFHNCVHLTNMYLFLVYGSALHFLYPELHYLKTNQKHICPNTSLFTSRNSHEVLCIHNCESDMLFLNCDYSYILAELDQ